METVQTKPVTSMGFKPMILGTGILHSIQLNYEAIYHYAKVVILCQKAK